MKLRTSAIVGKKRSSKASRLPFVQVFRWMMDTAAWRDLSLGARATYVELKALFNGSNNGRIAFGAREAAALIAMSPSSANRFLQELEEHGFIRRQQASSFGQKKLVTEWRLTELRNDVVPDVPSKEFMYWRPAGEIQNPVPPVKSSVPPAGLNRKREHDILSFSPTGDTVSAAVRLPQSHGRHPYICKPYGTSQIDETAVSITHPRPALYDDVKRILTSLTTIPAESVTSLAIGICADLSSERGRDPLVRALLETFPGSHITLSKAELSSEILRRVHTMHA